MSAKMLPPHEALERLENAIQGVKGYYATVDDPIDRETVLFGVERMNVAKVRSRVFDIAAGVRQMNLKKRVLGQATIASALHALLTLHRTGQVDGCPGEKKFTNPIIQEDGWFEVTRPLLRHLMAEESGDRSTLAANANRKSLEALGHEGDVEARKPVTKETVSYVLTALENAGLIYRKNPAKSRNAEQWLENPELSKFAGKRILLRLNTDTWLGWVKPHNANVSAKLKHVFREAVEEEREHNEECRKKAAERKLSASLTHFSPETLSSSNATCNKKYSVEPATGKPATAPPPTGASPVAPAPAGSASVKKSEAENRTRSERPGSDVQKSSTFSNQQKAEADKERPQADKERSLADKQRPQAVFPVPVEPITQEEWESQVQQVLTFEPTYSQGMAPEHPQPDETLTPVIEGHPGDPVTIYCRKYSRDGTFDKRPVSSLPPSLTAPVLHPNLKNQLEYVAFYDREKAPSLTPVIQYQEMVKGGFSPEAFYHHEERVDLDPTLLEDHPITGVRGDHAVLIEHFFHSLSCAGIHSACPGDYRFVHRLLEKIKGLGVKPLTRLDIDRVAWYFHKHDEKGIKVPSKFRGLTLEQLFFKWHDISHAALEFWTRCNPEVYDEIRQTVERGSVLFTEDWECVMRVVGSYIGNPRSTETGRGERIGFSEGGVNLQQILANRLEVRRRLVQLTDTNPGLPTCPTDPYDIEAWWQRFMACPEFVDIMLGLFDEGLLSPVDITDVYVWYDGPMEWPPVSIQTLLYVARVVHAEKLLNYLPHCCPPLDDVEAGHIRTAVERYGMSLFHASRQGLTHLYWRVHQDPSCLSAKEHAELTRLYNQSIDRDAPSTRSDDHRMFSQYYHKFARETAVNLLSLPMNWLPAIRDGKHGHFVTTVVETIGARLRKVRTLPSGRSWSSFLQIDPFNGEKAAVFRETRRFAKALQQPQTTLICA
jgi:hypothetical protein